MKNFGEFMVIILTTIISIIVKGFVLMKLWVWFITPTFNVNPLRLIETIGLVILLSFIFGKYKEPNEDFWAMFAKQIIFTITFSGTMLLIGWIAQSFI